MKERARESSRPAGPDYAKEESGSRSGQLGMCARGGSGPTRERVGCGQFGPRGGRRKKMAFGPERGRRVFFFSFSKSFFFS